MGCLCCSRHGVLPTPLAMPSLSQEQPYILKDGQNSPNTRSGGDIPAWKGHQEAPGPHRSPHSLCRVSSSSSVIFKSKCHSCQRAECLSSMCSFPPTHWSVRSTWETLERALELEEGLGQKAPHPPPRCLGLGQMADRGGSVEGRIARLCRSLQNFRNLPWNTHLKGWIYPASSARPHKPLLCHQGPRAPQVS